MLSKYLKKIDNSSETLFNIFLPSPDYDLGSQFFKYNLFTGILLIWIAAN